MKKSNFVEGAFISTFGIVMCKIIGIIYVIPFRAIIGVEGAILYSYAYTIYAVFASLSSTGIPSAMAKTVSEYNALEYYNSQERAFKITRKILFILGIISFLVLFIFAPQMAYLIIGDLEGGNSIDDITVVIRSISTALLVIPSLSVCKGYLQGHRMMQAPAVSNILEQVVRVVIILLGSFIGLKLLTLSVPVTVAIAVFGATVGAVVAYLYITKKIKNNKETLHADALIKPKEKKITNKQIAKKIVFYSLPFILIELVRSAFNTIDVFTVVRGLTGLGYEIGDAENVSSVLTTWGSKLNMIVLSISAGLTASIIPNVVRNATLKKYEDVERNILQALKIILFITIPMSIGISFLASSVWTIFYGYDSLSVSVFSIYILQTITTSISYILLDTTNALNKSKTAIIVLLLSFFIKAVLNIPMMHFFHYIGIESYYAPIFTTFLTQVVSTIILMTIIYKHTKINYGKLFKPTVKIILINMIMLVTLFIVRLLIGDFEPTRLNAILEITLYGCIGFIVYIYLSHKNSLIKNVFGEENIEKFFGRFSKKKKQS